MIRNFGTPDQFQNNLLTQNIHHIIPSSKLKAILTPGIVLMLVSTLFFALMQSIVKELDDLHVFQIIFFRAGITSILCMWYLRRRRLPLIGNSQKFLVLRSVFGVISMILFFITLQEMPLGVSVSLKYLAPVFTAILAVLFLDERVQVIQWIFFVIAIGGVFLLKGFDTRVETLYLILGISGALCYGIVYVLIRKIGTSEHPMVIINYFMLLATILSAISLFWFWRTPTIYESVLLLIIGVMGYYAQIFMTKALQMDLASRVAPVKYMELIFSLIIGLVWFGESYTFLGFIGIMMILVGMIVNIWVKRM
ncbi:MAG: DMT family transporter [Bacteroidia bacterium]|nr:DMT family transporter [Bacteroidia bacterium]